MCVCGLCIVSDIFKLLYRLNSVLCVFCLCFLQLFFYPRATIKNYIYRQSRQISLGYGVAFLKRRIKRIANANVTETVESSCMCCELVRLQIRTNTIVGLYAICTRNEE